MPHKQPLPGSACSLPLHFPLSSSPPCNHDTSVRRHQITKYKAVVFSTSCFACFSSLPSHCLLWLFCQSAASPFAAPRLLFLFSVSCLALPRSLDEVIVPGMFCCCCCCCWARVFTCSFRIVPFDMPQRCHSQRHCPHGCHNLSPGVCLSLCGVCVCVLLEACFLF